MSEEKPLLDAYVGNPDHLEEVPPIARPDGFPIRVLVRGDSALDPRAMGLADDIQRLVHAFLKNPHSSEGEESKAHTGHSTEDFGDIGVAVHGLGLSKEAEIQLVGRIRTLVQARAKTRDK